MEDYSAILKSWNSDKKIIQITQFDIFCDKIKIIFSDESTTCIEIMIPTNTRKHYVVKSYDQRDQWTHTINTFTIEKHPNLKKLLNIICKFVSKKKMDLACLENLPKVDVETNELEKKLLSLIPSSHSPLTHIQNNQQQPTALFSNVGSVIVHEYVSLYKSLRGSNKILLGLYNDNIYQWKILYKYFDNSELNNDMHNHKCDAIEVSITFHDKLYPNYPPSINIVNPQLKKMLNHVIPSLKMVQLTYWTPTRSVSFIVNKLYSILNKYAQIDNALCDYNKKIEGALRNLSSMCDISEFSESLDSEIYTSFVTIKKHDTSAGNGTGYHSTTQWDVDKYLASKHDRELQIMQIMNEIINEIQTPSNIICDQLYNSIIIQYIISVIDGVSVLEMNMNPLLYKSLFTFLQNITCDTYIKLFSLQFRGKCIYSMLENLCDSIKKEKCDDEMSQIIMMLFDMIKYMNIKIETPVVQQTGNIYVDIMDKLKFDTANIIKSDYYYKGELNQEKCTRSKQSISRIMSEYTNLSNNLPIHFNASIFVKTDESDLSVMRVLITGPDKTPYENGCFIFDVFLPYDYPTSHPNMWFLNHGGVRFNPNLYADGKICISLLGTWGHSSHTGENWNPTTSTIYQLLLSVQSQILVDFPFFNEPAFYNGQKKYTQESIQYNFNIRHYTMQFAILGLLESNHYSEFKQIITNHFKCKKEHVIKVCQQWVNEAPSQMKSQYINTFDKIKGALNAL